MVRVVWRIGVFVTDPEDGHKWRRAYRRRGRMTHPPTAGLRYNVHFINPEAAADSVVYDINRGRYEVWIEHREWTRTGAVVVGEVMAEADELMGADGWTPVRDWDDMGAAAD